MDYRKMYHVMLDGAERALEALEKQNYGLAKGILVAAETEAEEIFLQTEETEPEIRTVDASAPIPPPGG